MPIIWILTIIVSIFLIFTVYTSFSQAQNRISFINSFCPDGELITSNSFSYCDGKPFVCGSEGCSWVNGQVLGEDCRQVCSVVSTGYTTMPVCHKECSPVFG